ncbi:hypothetical protein KC353_g5224 [Hortaea werneckii]|uniref:Cytochrome P450 n=1 Tax=Hortaea werneckii TaxID=91943 RepID=A0A3M7CZT5_HORWE|nr:hypothetical protein KC353_g5224 [Hortaea werneckii]RMY57581.1 hypothetical protein D0865_03037 [Hortaea werneckii]
MNFLPTLQQTCAAILLLAASSVSTALTLIFLQLQRNSKVPLNLPWVDLRGKRWFPKIRANFHQIVTGREPISEGWTKYGKHGKPFVLPGLHWPEIILPPSHHAWIASQPEHILSDDVVQDELLGLPYFAHGPSTAAIHDFSVIRRDLTRQMGKLVPEMLDEVDAGFTDYFGTDNDWREVRAIEAILKVSQRAIERVFVGLPLCRDVSYLAAVRRWMMGFAICGALYRSFLPSMLQPALGHLLAIPLSVVKWLALRKSLPLIRRRMVDFDHQLRGQGTEKDVRVPNDMLQWLIVQNAHKTPIERLTAWDIGGRLCLFELFAVHTTSTTLGTALLDILLNPSSTAILTELQQEAEEILPQLPKDPKKAREMLKMDSLLRETLRIHSMFAHGMTRRVMPAEGIRIPDSDLWLPQGSHVAALVIPPQATLLGRLEEGGGGGGGEDDGLEWQPFRYHDQNRENKSSSSLEDETQEQPKRKQTATTQISSSFLSFGLGKHGCPGRFFAVQTLKLMLGYLVMRYDFELPKEGKDESGKRNPEEDEENNKDEEGKEVEVEDEKGQEPKPKMKMAMTKEERKYFADIGEVRLPKETARIRVRRRCREQDGPKVDE